MKGLALSGGGANGLFSIRILQLLKLDFKDIKYVSGVSVGSIIGAMITQNEFDKLYPIFTNLTNKQIYKGKLTLWRVLLNRIIGKNSVLDIEPLYQFLKQYISLEKAKKSHIKFHIGLTDYKTGEYKSFTQFDFKNNEDYVKCILASCSQPIIWKNIGFNTVNETIDFGYDGGVKYVSPLHDLVKYKDLDEMIIINNSTTSLKEDINFNHIEKVLLRTIDILLNTNFKKDIALFKEINNIVLERGEYNNRRYIKYKIYELPIEIDSLDFESKELVNLRIQQAENIFNNEK